MPLTSKTREQGGSIATTIPAEVARKLGIRPGEELFWVEDGAGGYHVTPFDPEMREILEAHEEIMHEYKDVFRALAE